MTEAPPAQEARSPQPRINGYACAAFAAVAAICQEHQHTVSWDCPLRSQELDLPMDLNADLRGSGSTMGRQARLERALNVHSAQPFELGGIEISRFVRHPHLGVAAPHRSLQTWFAWVRLPDVDFQPCRIYGKVQTPATDATH